MIKKLLVLAAAICMVFTVSANVFADCFGQLNLDYQINGQLQVHTDQANTYNNSEYDTNPLCVGLDYYLSRIKIGIDYQSGKVKDLDADINSILYKYGFVVVAADTFELDIMAGHDRYTIKPNIGNKEEASRTVYGIEASWFFGRSCINSSLYAGDADYKKNNVKVSDVSSALCQIKVKYTFLVNENLGLSLGMRVDGFGFRDDSTDTTTTKVNGSDTIGLVYRF